MNVNHPHEIYEGQEAMDEAQKRGETLVYAEERETLENLRERLLQVTRTIGPVTTIAVTAAQHGVMNPDGTWTVEEWEAPKD
jgi:hypothetical protein